MKRLITVLFATGLLAGFTSCKEQYTTYSDSEFVMFSDTMSMHVVLKDKDYFSVPVSSTITCDYDRTFGVEIVDKGSNAIERYHYRLLSNSITIKAGQRASEVRVHGYYDNLEVSDSLGFVLKLVAPDQLASGTYPEFGQTKVTFMKSCPFTIDDFTGWCMTSSMFVYEFPGLGNNNYQRLIRTEKHPKLENTIILRNWLYNGYDVNITLDPSKPEEPFITMEKDQVLVDEEYVFGQTHGDNKVLVTHSPAHISYYSSCNQFAALWIKVYVTNQGSTEGIIGGGAVGYFYNVLEWVSDEEAERLQREEGM